MDSFSNDWIIEIGSLKVTSSGLGKWVKVVWKWCGARVWIWHGWVDLGCFPSLKKSKGKISKNQKGISKNYGLELTS